MVDKMKSQVFADVYQVHDESRHTHYTNWEHRNLDIVEFSIRDNYDDIAKKICDTYNDSTAGAY